MRSAGLEHGLRQTQLTAKRFEGQSGITHGAADINIVARPSAAAQQRLPMGHISHHGDRYVQWALCGVTAHQLAAMGLREREQALRKTFQPGFIGAGHGQGQQKCARFCATGGQIAEVHGQTFVTQPHRIHGAQEVPAFDQHVGRDGQLVSRARGQQRAVVANPQIGMAYGSLEEAVNQVEFTHVARITASAASLSAGCAPGCSCCPIAG